MRNTQIIGVDMSNSGDYTAISSYCSNCKNIIYIKCFAPGENGIKAKLYKKCPNCGSKISKHIICE